jgi:hypothetical protein
MGLKMHTGIRTWNWKERTMPEPMLEANRRGSPPNMTQIATVDGIGLYKATIEQEYAIINHQENISVCQATGTGGIITVACNSDKAGVLSIKENNWTGWQALIDGQPTELLPDDWLSVSYPGGRHIIDFVYRPTDVYLGVVLHILGWLGVVYLWSKRKDSLFAENSAEA